MSDRTDSYWVTLAIKVVGIVLTILGALMIYYTATSTELGSFGLLFGFLSVVLLAIGIFLLIAKPPQ